jgi:hypothetical protein
VTQHLKIKLWVLELEIWVIRKLRETLKMQPLIKWKEYEHLMKMLHLVYQVEAVGLQAQQVESFQVLVRGQIIQEQVPQHLGVQPEVGTVH